MYACAFSYAFCCRQRMILSGLKDTVTSLDCTLTAETWIRTWSSLCCSVNGKQIADMELAAGMTLVKLHKSFASGNYFKL